MSRDTEPLAGNDRHTRWSGPSGSRRRLARGSAVRQVPRHECPAPLSSPDPRGLSPCVWGPKKQQVPGSCRTRPGAVRASPSAPHPSPLPPAHRRGTPGGVCPDRGAWLCGWPWPRRSLPPPPSHLSALGSLSTRRCPPPRPSPPLRRASPPGPHPGPGSGWGPAGALQAGTPGRGRWWPSAPRHAPGGPSPERGLGPRRPPPHTAPRLRRARPVPAEASPGRVRGLPASGLARRQPPAPRAHPSGGGVHGRDVTRACGHPCPCQP